MYSTIQLQFHIITHYRRVPFSRATNFANGTRKGVCGNHFHETILAKLFIIHVNLHLMEFSLIFGETYFVEVPKIRKIHEIYGPRKRVLYGIKSINVWVAT